ncbi:hypothetical protein CARUB_v10023852mg [Capsella rubella]|uniref:DUF1685 domain-containing protein n=1 Tax=Capsella rubella TaxID=81985 RepID=R0HDS9_9BRAS|nr:uncharacterized protein LOC17887642 [Capsella rubella]EOA27699.1 hypothetical protein CARUB_v10023852mg [Capsella rubella]
MAGEDLLRLFEQNWSERLIFKKDKENLNGGSRSGIPKKKEAEEDDMKNSSVSFLVERAMSDETMMMTTTSSKTSLFSSSSDDLFLSPRSVLPVKANPMKLQTILSGKAVNEFTIAERERALITKKEDLQRKNSNKMMKRNVRRRKGKSMSDLEYEELKGFMDLGFVFSEEDHKDSDLVSILPGLQRSLLKKDDGVAQAVTEEEEDMSNGNRVARPYLSEAWDHCGGRKGKKQLKPEIKWRVPAPAANEVDLKDNLRLWAHAVASTIR